MGNLLDSSCASLRALTAAIWLSFSMFGCGNESPDAIPANTEVSAAKTVDSVLAPSMVNKVTQPNNEHRYFFNVKGHTREEVESLLKRAQEVYDSLPNDRRESFEVAMVLHGPDTQFFAKKNYSENKNLVDLAAKLEAFGFIDFKVCAASAKMQGLGIDSFPPFIEVVPYGPGALETLKQDGYTEL